MERNGESGAQPPPFGGHPNPNAPSFWLSLAAPSPTAPLQGSLVVDVAIVGGGFTGLWSAIRLAEAAPHLRIALLEAQTVGYGASGRNGGFAMTMVGRNLHDLVRKVGVDQAREVHLAMVRTLTEIEEFCRTEGIDAAITHPGLLTVSNGPEQDVRIDQDLRAAELCGLGDFRAVDAAECRQLVAAEQVRKGHFEEHALLLDPAALARGLREAALRRGVAVYERTPGLQLHAAPERVVIETPQGSVLATQALIATNAYAHAVPALRRFIFTIAAYITLTAPLNTDQWGRIGWSRRMGIEDKRIMPHFHRPTADGRILWGGRDAPVLPGGPDPERDHDERIFGRLRESFRWTFPSLADVPFEQAWGGPVCGTINCMPHVGRLRRSRVLYALGYAGHGVGSSALVAAAVRDLVLERRSPAGQLPFVTKRMVPLPPGPLRAPVLGGAQRLLQAADDSSDSRSPKVRLALRFLQ